jgi:hypothetical protein
MTCHYDSRAIWFLSIPGRFSKSSLTLQFDDTILLEGLRRESLYNRSSFCPRVSSGAGYYSPLREYRGCSLASLVWFNAAFLFQLPNFFICECALHGLRLAIIPIIWFSYFVRVFVSCVLVYLIA